MDMIEVDAHLREAGRYAGGEPFSGQLAVVTDAWDADKQAAALMPDVPDVRAALFGVARLRIGEAVAVVRDATAAL